MTILGPDVSVYQQGIKLTDADWDRAQFLIARATHRGNHVDDSWNWWKAQAKAHDVPFAAYCFVRPLARMGVTEQVDAIKRAMGDTPVPLWFDHESDGSIQAISDHDLLVLGGAVHDAGFDVPAVYTGWYSDTDPFTAADLKFLGYRGIINARYPRQPNAGPPRGDHAAWYSTVNGDTGPGWDYDPGPAVSTIPVLIWQYTSVCRWGTDESVDWNAIRDPAILDSLFHDWSPPTPPPPPSGDDVNWNPDAATVAAIRTMPGVADTLAGTVNTWAVIGLIKAVQELKGLPVTGKPDQATWLAVNKVLEPGVA